MRVEFFYIIFFFLCVEIRDYNNLEGGEGGTRSEERGKRVNKKCFLNPFWKRPQNDLGRRDVRNRTCGITLKSVTDICYSEEGGRMLIRVHSEPYETKRPCAFVLHTILFIYFFHIERNDY